MILLKPAIREILCFILIGCSVTAVDFLIYSFLQLFLIYSISKTFSFVCGSVLAYFLNKNMTFQQKKKSVIEAIKFSTLYFSSMFINVAMNSLSLFLLKKMDWLSDSNILIYSFLVATAFSTVLNFVGQKYWVFRKEEIHYAF